MDSIVFCYPRITRVHTAVRVEQRTRLMIDQGWVEGNIAVAESEGRGGSERPRATPKTLLAAK